MELDLLKEHERNDDRDGMVIFNSSHYGSMRTGEILRSFPKNGVVIVLSRSELGHGHIETLAVGKGLTLLFGTDFNEESIMATTKCERRPPQAQIKIPCCFGRKKGEGV